MANQRAHGDEMHHNPLDFLNWPVLGVAATGWATGMWQTLWEHVPGPTAVYMAISAGFMLFQMFDKLGLLERLKRHPKPKEH